MWTLREARFVAFRNQLIDRMRVFTTGAFAVEIVDFTIDFCRSHERGAQPAISNFLELLILSGVRNPIDCPAAAEEIVAAQEAQELASRLALARLL